MNAIVPQDHRLRVFIVASRPSKDPKGLGPGAFLQHIDRRIDAHVGIRTEKLGRFANAFRWPRMLLRAIRLARRVAPDILYCPVGGSRLMATWMGWRLRLPVVLHENGDPASSLKKEYHRFLERRRCVKVILRHTQSSSLPYRHVREGKVQLISGHRSRVLVQQISEILIRVIYDPVPPSLTRPRRRSSAYRPGAEPETSSVVEPSSQPPPEMILN